MHAFFSRLWQHLYRPRTRHHQARERLPTVRLEPAPPTRPAQVTSTRPRLRPRGDRDHGPSLHTLVVPGLITSGYTAEQISELTGLPQALVELIADAHGPDRPSPAVPPTTVNGRSARATLARRRRTRTTAVLVLAAALMIAASAASVTEHKPTLGAAAALGSILLSLTVSAYAHRRFPGTRDRPHPPR